MSSELKKWELSGKSKKQIQGTWQKETAELDNKLSIRQLRDVNISSLGTMQKEIRDKG